MSLELFGPSITELDIKIVLDAMQNGWYGDRKYWYVENFEREFARYHNRKYAMMTPNCTSAIHLLLLGLGIGPGDEVIVPECTWIASATHISHIGAKTVFADIDEATWCMSADSLERAISPRTKAVIVVDLYGNMPDMYNLVVNSNHPLISKILNESNEDKQKNFAKQATDLALLSQGLLKGEGLTNFIKRSVEMI